ncbi:MAG TPA: mechanosensitive ion channel protein MscS [Holosporales bacterium]|nr:mechanosensitive ion channel protein MscS [Holosporales bacterium]
MSNTISSFFSNFSKSKIPLEQFTEIALIIASLFAAFFITKILIKKLSMPLLEKLEKKSQNFLDIEKTTLSILIIFIALLWFVDLGFVAFKEKTALIKPIFLVLLSWGVIRGVTHNLDRSLLSRFVNNVLWLTAALFVTGYLHEFSKFLKSYSYTIGKVDLSLHTFIFGIIVFSVLLWVSSLITLLINKILKKNKKINKTQKVLIMKIVRIVLYTVVFISSFQVVGFDLTTLTIFGGAVAFGIGFGLQKIFSNLISGFILLLDKSIRPGDVIALTGANGKTYGEVKKLDARYVSVVTRDGKKHLIPNETLISERVENWSYSDDKIRLHIPVGVSYASDLDLVRKLMLEAADEASERILKTPEPVCLLTGFGDSSVDFELRVWINDPHNGCERPKSDVLLNIWTKFNKHKVLFPFPQMDVHLVNAPKTKASKIRKKK